MRTSTAATQVPWPTLIWTTKAIELNSARIHYYLFSCSGVHLLSIAGSVARFRFFNRKFGTLINTNKVLLIVEFRI